MLAQTTSDVTLSIPARPGYLSLARLALSAVCRLTPLTAGEVADLKLAVNEAAADFMVGGDAEVGFRFTVGEGALELEMQGTRIDGDADERGLRRAIVTGICEQATFTADTTVLVAVLGEDS